MSCLLSKYNIGIFSEHGYLRSFALYIGIAVSVMCYLVNFCRELCNKQIFDLI